MKSLPAVFAGELSGLVHPEVFSDAPIDYRKIVEREITLLKARAETLKYDYDRTLLHIGRLETIMAEAHEPLHIIRTQTTSSDVSPSPSPRSVASAICDVLALYPAGLTAMEIGQRVRRVRPDVKVSSIIAEVYAMRTKHMLDCEDTAPKTFRRRSQTVPSAILAP